MNQTLIKKFTSEHTAFNLTDSLGKFLVKWTALTLSIFVICYFTLPIREDIALKLDIISFYAENLLWLMAGVSSGVAFYYSAFPQKISNLNWIVVFFSLCVLLFATLSRLDTLHLSTELPGEFDLWRGRCGFIILTLSLMQSSFLVTWVRKLAPRNEAITGLWASLSAGSIGCLVMQSVCMHENSMHLIVWHFIPLAIICYFGQLVSKKILRW
jgi:hypothetical protein